MSRTTHSEKVDSAWLSVREKIRVLVNSSTELAHDFKLDQPRALLVPFDPFQQSFFSGFTALHFSHIALEDYRKSAVFDPRFCRFHQLADLGIALQKGSKAFHSLHVYKRVKLEQVDCETGAIFEHHVPLRQPVREYSSYFHSSQFVQRPVPALVATVRQVEHPFQQQSAMEQLVASIVGKLGVDVVFHTCEMDSEFSASPLRIDLSDPSFYQSDLALFHSLISYLLLCARSEFAWDSKLDDAIRVLGVRMFFDALLLDSVQSWDVAYEKSVLDSISDDELFFSCLYAEQAVRSLLFSSGFLTQIARYRQMVGALLHRDFIAMSTGDLKEISNGEVLDSQQSSESQVVTF